MLSFRPRPSLLNQHLTISPQVSPKQWPCMNIILWGLEKPSEAWPCSLTPAVWESIVACCTADALPPDDVGQARTLPAVRTAVMAGSPSRVALTGQGSVMVKGYQGPCRIPAESRGCLRTIETKELSTYLRHVSVPSFPFLPVPTSSISRVMLITEFGKGWKMALLWIQQVTAPSPNICYRRGHHRNGSGNLGDMGQLHNEPCGI